tara:strand:- start:9501 stop:10691 length:1191 start_codon:yes stop_codon:yes gene_type:complete
MITNMRKIEYLVGNGSISRESFIPYSKEICNFISDLSNELNLNSLSRKYPDIKTFSFWCRKKNIESLKKNYFSEKTRLGLGLIFHITPSNIPTNFAYSLIFGLITGNSNIIKVPSKKFDQIDIICKAINKILKNKYKIVKKMISVVRYSDNDDYTNKISSICDARLIWGGDNSIKNIRKFPLKHRALDLAFADRYSFCVINAQDVLKLNQSKIKRLVENFYNDTYLVDQNACSSPHLILWMGKNVNKVRNKFWKSLSHLVKKKYVISESASIDKYAQLCTDIISLNNMKKHEVFEDSVYTISLKKLDKNIHNLRGKWGFFYEHNINDLNEIKNYVNNKYQTLTYFGLKKRNLTDFVLKNKLDGIDRIVPIGQALDINFFWDGYDLNKILSRVIDIK